MMIYGVRTRKDSEGLRGHPRPGVDSNVSVWSRPSIVAVHTAVSPGFCTLPSPFH